MMKVKIIDEEHEKDLENGINKFIKENNIDIIDIKLSSSCSIYGEEQIYCFTALIMYVELKSEK
ncbi:MAG: sporulation protein Cse60 [Bacilli bacterium]|nr:sporulation protein Cse60 [Bacilli bacterium]